eukprot:scaffold18189_cov31-Tisochrysis_lutea.AAC.1
MGATCISTAEFQWHRWVRQAQLHFKAAVPIFPFPCSCSLAALLALALGVGCAERLCAVHVVGHVAAVESEEAPFLQCLSMVIILSISK